MDLLNPITSFEAIWLSFVMAAVLFVFALVLAPWEKIRSDSGAQHVYLGTIVLLYLVWMIRAELPTGLNIHLLGASLVCLLFEWQFALFATAIVVAVHTGVGNLPWMNYALNWLTLGAVPVIFTRSMLYVVQRYLPHNFFIYIFINTFFVAGIGAYIAGSVSAIWLYYLLDYSSQLIVDQYLPTLVLIIFPEAACTGMVMTILVVYKPTWVATFHDRWYLKNR
ncbi:MAG: energy-coupling factor ABC transporter permease [Gammaproteobacteria bacterium]|nr:energy-coupling factor ABC transporter permease [Gammaproteobacteria bacterium]